MNTEPLAPAKSRRRRGKLSVATILVAVGIGASYWTSLSPANQDKLKVEVATYLAHPPLSERNRDTTQRFLDLLNHFGTDDPWGPAFGRSRDYLWSHISEFDGVQEMRDVPSRRLTVGRLANQPASYDGQPILTYGVVSNVTLRPAPLASGRAGW
jgi:hypothetical protein